ncbi:hypothetical protein OEZ85_009761 [Tetradesmus obliquus]|uniref:Uncharacterized protein n=1 Tax=Tetradesmus obliquus TaxID=3088 RepID=A0ABY8UA16_TETOB|nr:hypothetical protein OEZ85_009761 [Tetradesmus obliquus]
MFSTSNWTTRLAVLGALAGATICAKALRLLYLWAELKLGPVRLQRFKRDWALVTGGSEGVGKAVAKALAAQGLNLVLVSRSQQKLDAAAADIQQRWPQAQVRTIAADLTAPGSCQQLLQSLSDTPVSVLIANVGGGICGPCLYWHYSDADEAYVQALNGQACYSLVKGLLPGMVARNKGAVVAVSSIMHQWGSYAAPYGAEKAKMNALMAMIDSELALAGVTGVSVQAMVLGPVDTPGVAQLMNNAATAAATAAHDADPAAAAAAAAKRRQAFSNAISAEVVAASMVKCIGKGGPVVTPYWKHALQQQLMLGECLWPPALQRAVKRAISRKFKAVCEGQE